MDDDNFWFCPFLSKYIAIMTQKAIIRNAVICFNAKYHRYINFYDIEVIGNVYHCCDKSSVVTIKYKD